MISDTETFAQGLTRRERVWLMAWEASMTVTDICATAIFMADQALVAFDKHFPDYSTTIAVAPVLFDPIQTTTPSTSGGFVVERVGGEV